MPSPLSLLRVPRILSCSFPHSLLFYCACVTGKSYDELQQMRAKELKNALAAANVKVDDCFEKSQLVQRALEAGGKQ